jgi:hypothetical protein
MFHNHTTMYLWIGTCICLYVLLLMSVGLFNEYFSTAEVKDCRNKQEGNDEWRVCIWNEPAVTYSKLMSRYFPGNSEKSTKTSARMAVNPAGIRI